MSPPFIVIDGIDGSGKTTQIQMLKNYMEEHQIRCHFTAEPSKGELGLILRTYLKDASIPHELDALMFAADRIHHYYYEVKPHLDEGEIVISDRYKDSSIAYQTSQGLDREWITHLNSRAPPADLTIILDIDPKLALARIAQGRSDAPEKFERLDMQISIRDIFLEIATDQYNYIVLNANVDAEQLHERIVSILHERFEI